MPFHLHLPAMLVLSILLALAAAPAPQQQTIPPPTLISPASGAVMDNGCLNQSDPTIWDFDWEDVAGATEYHIKVWHNPLKPVVNDRNVTESQYQHASTGSYIIERNRKGWCWSVRARVQGQWGDWSEVRCFEAEPVNTDCP